MVVLTSILVSVWFTSASALFGQSGSSSLPTQQFQRHTNLKLNIQSKPGTSKRRILNIPGLNLNNKPLKPSSKIKFQPLNKPNSFLKKPSSQIKIQPLNKPSPFIRREKSQKNRVPDEQLQNVFGPDERGSGPEIPQGLQGVKTVITPSDKTNKQVESRGEDIQVRGKTRKEKSKYLNKLRLRKCPAGCRDKNINCAAMKREGQCEKLSEKQLTQCRCSCLKCQSEKGRGYKPKGNGKVEYNAKNCGKRKTTHMIVGGKEAKSGAWPWIVSIIHINSASLSRADRLKKESFCGGTLINPRTVITAAHCFLTFALLTPRIINVRVGDLQVDKEDPGEEVVALKHIIVHKEYNENTAEHDIAMLILEKDVDMSQGSHIRPACLPTTEPTEQNCFVAGWGVEKEGGRNQAKKLMQIKVPIIKNSRCNKSFRNSKIKEGMLCAGKKKGGKDACQGDSGGPLVCKNKNKQYDLTGVVSWGEGCGRKEKYGVYTRVVRYLEWIKEQMKKNP